MATSRQLGLGSPTLSSSIQAVDRLQAKLLMPKMTIAPAVIMQPRSRCKHRSAATVVASPLLLSQHPLEQSQATVCYWSLQQRTDPWREATREQRQRARRTKLKCSGIIRCTPNWRRCMAGQISSLRLSRRRSLYCRYRYSTSRLKSFSSSRYKQ